MHFLFFFQIKLKHREFRNQFILILLKKKKKENFFELLFFYLDLYLVNIMYDQF